MIKYLRYLRYLAIHKWYVFRECLGRGLIWRGIIHDFSKFLPSEFIPYARYFYGAYPKMSDMTSGEKERYFLNGGGLTKEWVRINFDEAWLYHQHRNKHHHQFWCLRYDNGDVKPLEMPLVFVKELVADWRGAGMAVNGKDDILGWYIKNRDNMLLHKTTRINIEKMIGYNNGC